MLHKSYLSLESVFNQLLQTQTTQKPEKSSITNSQLVLFCLMINKFAYAQKIVLPHQSNDNKYLINCQAPKYSFFALNNITKK